MTISVTGAAIFLRYSLTGFLRFWMARQSYELNLLAERVFPGSLHDTPAGVHSAEDTHDLTRAEAIER